MAVHGDSADMSDSMFGRDAENSKAQEAFAATLWNKAPRIYDDEIIVRMPFDTLYTAYSNAGSDSFLTFDTTTNLATFAGGNIKPFSVRAASLQLNNIFTPWSYAVGMKPRGYAWYSQLYNYYQVLEVRWTVYVKSLASVTGSNTAALQLTSDQPVYVNVAMSDNVHTDFSAGGAAGFNQDRNIMEMAHNNGADKSLVYSHGTQLSGTFAFAGADQPSCHTFNGVWTPAKFDDLQIDITRQPMTATGSPPNWANWLDVYFVNFNTVNATWLFKYDFHCEFLCHWKKINATKYATPN